MQSRQDIAKALLEVAKRVNDGRHAGAIYDGNGNHTGDFTIDFSDIGDM